MCEFFSGVSTFINGTRHDYVSSEGLMSHTAIMEEHHLKDSLATWGRIVSWELVPLCRIYDTPPSRWELKADVEFSTQSCTPDWWKENEDEVRSFAIREASKRILTTGTHTITGGVWVVRGDAKVTVDVEDEKEDWRNGICHILSLSGKACATLIRGTILQTSEESFLNMKGGRCSKAGGKSFVHLQGGMLSLARHSATILLDKGWLEHAVGDVRLIHRGGTVSRMSNSVFYQKLS